MDIQSRVRSWFEGKQPESEVLDEEETVRRNSFTTSATAGKMTGTALRTRQIIAMSRTFQKGIDSLVAVTPSGERSPDIDYAMDEAYPDLTQAKLQNSRGGYLPIQQLEWYANQGFIGWQMCGILAQNWLIDKACGVPAQDAVRKGYEVTLNDGQQLEPEVANAIRLADKRMNIAGKMKSFVKKGRIFGIRHAMFIIDGIDYELPFNPDGIRPGSYRGITQIDPYWIAPELDYNAAANPASPEFYNPTWWRVNGKRVHRSHFIIMRNGDEVVDILKPAYIYGGIPIPQKIFERVYSAERTANEAPQLLLSKRAFVFKTDMTKIFGPDNNFNAEMEEWMQLLNNFGMKAIDRDDDMQQFETSLAELNETIMTQYGLVAAASNVPITKLLGTAPKGMDATGEYDEASYHEEVESIQAEICTPFIERHHLCLMRSSIAPKFGIAPLGTEVVWKPLDSYTTKELAEINEINSRTAKNYADLGALDGFDVRGNLIADPESGYNGIDPIVPGGPGDREHEQEVAEQLLANSSAPGESKEKKQDQVMDQGALYAGVMYRSGDKILLMKRADDRNNGGVWSFPAGTIEAGETAMECALREFNEETGKRLDYVMPFCDAGTFMLFISSGDEFTPMLCPEHTAYAWFGLNELPSPLHEGVRRQIMEPFGPMAPAAG